MDPSRMRYGCAYVVPWAMPPFQSSHEHKHRKKKKNEGGVLTGRTQPSGVSFNPAQAHHFRRSRASLASLSSGQRFPCHSFFKEKLPHELVVVVIVNSIL